MTLVVVELCAPLLAAVGLSKLWEGGFDDKKKVSRVVAISAALTGGVALIFAIIGGGLFDMSGARDVPMLMQSGFPQQIAETVAAAMRLERGSILSADALRTVLYVLATAAIVMAYIYEKLPKRVMLVVCGLLAVADLGGVAWRHLSYDNFVSPSKAKITATAADRAILQDKGEEGYRVMNMTVSTFNDATTSYFHRSVGGYHGAKLARYQDVIDNYLGRADSAVLDMLNTRYLIVPSQTQQGAREVVMRPSALGAAWIVSNVVRSETPQQEISMLGRINLSNTAVVDKRFTLSGGAATKSGGEIVLESYIPHHLTYRYSSETPSTVIFSEVYYDKGWTAYVDGVEAPYFRANYILRGMELPAGEHIVEWKFRSPRWGLVEGISYSAALLIIFMVLFMAWRDWRVSKVGKDVVEE